MEAGKVWLVGAGPSDPGLFTRKGMEVLAQAETVVYDALVGQEILELIPETAELINVGKRSSHHIMKQEQINQVLVQKAREGKRVVRLKGGDPFLFGRGGEELELLTAEHIAYEVVPGVTSALSVPAYQGIPVTHRDYCSSVHIITGHKRAGQSYDIDFEALVRTGGTLVFLMGVASLGDICRGLLAAGMEPETPAALLMQGTTAAQRRIVSTVAGLEEEVQRQGAMMPAIIVVGKVCGLAREFSWYEKQPLGGVKVLLTRPRQLISETARKLREKGAEVLELPAIRTEKIPENHRLREALQNLKDYRWIVFTSPTGVRIFFEEMAENEVDHPSLAYARFAVIGTGTAKELRARGFYPDLMPEVFDGAHLGEALRKACGPKERILIPRAALGTPELTAPLEGLLVEDIPTYDTKYETSRFVDIREEFETGKTRYALFTSASTVRGFAAAAGEMDFSQVRAVCIGKQTEAAAKELGMQTWVAKRATMDSLVERLEELVADKS